MRWFGEPWDSFCKAEQRVVVPQDMTCEWCELPFAADAQGVMPAGDLAFHKVCHIRLAIGSVGHQMEMCGCYGVDDISEEGMSRYAAAEAAVQFFDWQQQRLISSLPS